MRQLESFQLCGSGETIGVIPGSSPLVQVRQLGHSSPLVQVRKLESFQLCGSGEKIGVIPGSSPLVQVRQLGHSSPLVHVRQLGLVQVRCFHVLWSFQLSNTVGTGSFVWVSLN